MIKEATNKVFVHIARGLFDAQFTYPVARSTVVIQENLGAAGRGIDPQLAAGKTSFQITPLQRQGLEQRFGSTVAGMLQRLAYPDGAVGHSASKRRIGLCAPQESDFDHAHLHPRARRNRHRDLRARLSQGDRKASFSLVVAERMQRLLGFCLPAFRQRAQVNRRRLAGSAAQRQVRNDTVGHTLVDTRHRDRNLRWLFRSGSSGLLRREKRQSRAAGCQQHAAQQSPAVLPAVKKGQKGHAAGRSPARVTRYIRR